MCVLSKDRMLDVLHCNIKRYKSKTTSVTYPEEKKEKVENRSEEKKEKVENRSFQAEKSLRRLDFLCLV